MAPKDGFLPGPDDRDGIEGLPDDAYAPHFYASCHDIRFDAQTSTGKAWNADYTCSETTTSRGERVEVTDLVMNNPANVSYRTLTVTVYRADGNAVSVTNKMMNHFVDGAPHLADLATVDYALDAEGLIALAEALPDVIVE
ncbi:hypothetical protein Pen01_35620 [Phytomonospora endophytica]|nr:hypothetical protein Pen01_35620 [Phytomonospora endophytica]